MTGGYTSAIVPLMPGCQGSGGLVHDWEGVAESTAKKVPHVNNIKSAPQKHIAFFFLLRNMAGFYCRIVFFIFSIIVGSWKYFPNMPSHHTYSSMTAPHLKTCGRKCCVFGLEHKLQTQSNSIPLWGWVWSWGWGWRRVSCR